MRKGAIYKGPEIVLRDGKLAAVILDFDEYQKMPQPHEMVSNRFKMPYPL
jgi:hypothetical protein